jgi:hypothetical protein
MNYTNTYARKLMANLDIYGISVINEYFNKLIFQKIDQRENYSIYGAQVVSSYGDGRKQYVLAFVPVHLSILQKAYLRELPWHNLQTRMLKHGYRLVPQKWEVVPNLPNLFFQIQERTENYSRYTSEQNLPLELLLMHDPRKKTKYQYYNRMSLLGALNTFQCVLNYIGTDSPIIYTSQTDSQTDFQSTHANYIPNTTPVWNFSKEEIIDDSFELV